MMSSRTIPSAFVKSVLQNGVGRYVCQLQRLTLKFCKSRSDSRGLRDFIENHMLEFTRENPGIVVYLQPRRHRTPRLLGEYLNGKTVQFVATNFSQDEVCQWIEHLRTRSGQDIVRLRKTWHTDTPSIQGTWTPFTNKDPALNVTNFPCTELSPVASLELSATERLLELAKQMREGKPAPINGGNKT